MNEQPPDSVVLLGAGGLVHIMYWHLQKAWPGTKVAIVDEYIEKDEAVFSGHTFPIIHDWDLSAVRREHYGDENQGFRHFLLAVTEPKYKKSFVEKALERGLEPAPTLIDPSVIVVGDDVRIGKGGFLMAGCVIQADAVLEDYVSVASMALVSHHCQVGKYASFSPGAIALGFVTMGEGVHLGAGTMVRGYLSIAPWVNTGMQAAVARNLDEAGETYVGVPARKLEKR
jgi:acetyltransferase-like isoleucine patch superfamily enzyme